MRAHIVSLILIHVGVGQRCRATDVESPAILPTTSTRNVPAGRWMEAQEQFKRRAHISSLIIVHVGVGQRCRARNGESPALPAARARSVSIGAMERYTWVRLSGKLTNCHNAHSTGQHSSVGRWMEFQGYFKWRAHLVSLISVHVGVGQHRRARDVESPALPTMSTRNVPSGRWMNVQGKGQDASTHLQRCCHGYHSLQS